MSKGRKKAAVEGVYQRGNTWYVRYWKDDKDVRKSFKKDRAAAVAYAEEVRRIREERDGFIPTTAKELAMSTADIKKKAIEDAISNAITVGRLCDEFKKYVEANPDEYRDQKNPPRRIDKVKAVFGDRAAESLKSSEIEDWLDQLQEDDELANATINKLRGTFSMIFKHGKRKDLIAVNPAADVPLKDVGNGVERFMSEEEEKRLRAVMERNIDAHDLDKHPELRKQAIHRLIEFEISVKTGMRRSEQYNLRWPDVDFKRRVMRLRKTKNGKPRNAFIIDDVATALKQLQALEITPRKRPKTGNDESMSDLVFAKLENKKWFDAALKDAKIFNFTWHCLRHTFCSRLVQKGVHLKVVQEAAGHASIASTMRYAHFAPSQVLDAMAVLNQQVA
jgi:site-specific recombinase XerD